MPDLGKCKALAELFDVSLDDLANYESEQNMSLGVPPRGKHLFGVVTVGEKGQIIIPAKARKLFSINAGDQLVVLGEDGQGMALIKANDFLFIADAIRKKEMNMDET